MIVTSTRNPAVRAARRLARSAGARARGDAFVAEGPQAVREAGAALRSVFATEAAQRAHPDLMALAVQHGAEVLTVGEAVIEAVADTVNPQGVVAVVEVARPALDEVLSGAGLVVICVEVRDPGNAGTIVRTAAAAGADAVVLAGQCVDTRNPKAVRASAGSVFHVPIAGAPEWEGVVSACQRAGLQLVAADAAGTVAHHDVDLTRPTALVLGNEAHGLPARVLASCDAVAAIPMAGPAESLNLAAAAAVLVFEAARQRATQMVRP